MYEIIVNNWKIIVDEEEKKILINYSDRGRFFTILYSLFLTSICISFVLFPLMPATLHKLKILSSHQPLIFIMNGEFIADRESHYWKIYLFDCMTCLTVLAIYTPIDGMYRVCVEQCFALYSIITHRLLKPYAILKDQTTLADEVSYKRILQIIKLHKRTLRFNKSLQESYSACFLMILLANVVEIPVGCNLLLMTAGSDSINCFRYSTIVATMFAHLLWVCWPGQKLIDHSSRLSFDAYSSEWYRFAKRSRTLLRIFMLRCTEPVCITAGGLVDINMANYASTVRKALSYTAAVSSFQ
ncbi:uncharacterized protein LOC131665364 [Phymastichus coffea]|uniref:uncharacterized protein LOC131665364 n=1 Tax=Phymastichus coffea TaxID=108790 RepID=UPI00273C8DFC|nr:uncharacterized protein LOC131665364 [Phymastichus coffea]